MISFKCTSRLTQLTCQVQVCGCNGKAVLIEVQSLAGSLLELSEFAMFHPIFGWAFETDSPRCQRFHDTMIL